MNRHSRLLLSILIVAAVVVPYWYWSDAPGSPSADPNPIAAPAVRGGSIVTSMRTDPRSFNRLVQQATSTDI